MGEAVKRAMEKGKKQPSWVILELAGIVLVAKYLVPSTRLTNTIVFATNGCGFERQVRRLPH